jgi:hypothetical protein
MIPISSDQYSNSQPALLALSNFRCSRRPASSICFPPNFCPVHQNPAKPSPGFLIQLSQTTGSVMLSLSSVPSVDPKHRIHLFPNELFSYMIRSPRHSFPPEEKETGVTEQEPGKAGSENACAPTHFPQSILDACYYWDSLGWVYTEFD